MKQIIDKNVENIIEDNMLGYAASVLLDRAIPDIRDGFKPSVRRILYSMYLQKAFHLVKSANAAGSVMRLHPHGSTYGVMVGMVQRDNQSIPLLSGKGNFGQHTSRDLMPGADRYTEVKLSEISIDMMKDFNKGLVNFIDNYDGTIRMPEVLPVKFPSILAYCQSGIGVGFSSSIASYNLNELCDATIKYIKTGNHDILVPDFATGGYILNEENVFNQINKTGTGTIKLRGKAEINGNEILITEIPYTTTREAIIEKIIDLAKTQKLKEVVDVKDLTGLKGLLIEVTARRGTDMNLLLQKLYQFTPLQSTHSSNMNILVDNLPKVLGVHQVIEKWIDWRRSCIKRSVSYDIQKMKEKLHILQGLEKVLVDIDKAIEIIRTSKEDLIEINLGKYFGIDYEQASEVSNMKLRNINKDYIIKKIKDIHKLNDDILEYQEILGDDKKIDQLVIDGLEETKSKYGKPRLTQIIEVAPVQQIVIEENIPNYLAHVYVTKDGYCYKFKNNQEPNLKPGDEVLHYFETMNDAELIVFGEDILCYKIKLSSIEETKAGSLGVYIPTVLRVNDLKIVSYSIYDDQRKFIIIAYDNNKVAKISMKVFEGNRRVLKRAYNEKQKVVNILTLKDEEKLKITTDKTLVEINTTDLPLASSRVTPGIYSTRKGKMIKIEVA